MERVRWSNGYNSGSAPLPGTRFRAAPAQTRTKLGAEASAAQKSSQVAPIRKVAVIRATAKPVSAPNRNGHISGKEFTGPEDPVSTESHVFMSPRNLIAFATNSASSGFSGALRKKVGARSTSKTAKDRRMNPLCKNRGRLSARSTGMKINMTVVHM